MPLMNFNGQSGRQIRILDPQPGKPKSYSEYGSTWRYFLNWWNKELDEILIVEWEIDFLSILPYITKYNLIWLKWINNLPRCIREIEWLNKVYDVYLLVDNDEAANNFISRIPYTPLHLYDVRDALSWCKDVNEAICQNKLNLDVFPKRIVKLKPKPKKQYLYSDTIDTINKINAIPVMDILERLFPEYALRWQCGIAEWGSETSWYKYSKRLNIVTDFSGKGRPEGGPFQIAKKKFWDTKLVFEYFKGLTQ